jgi:hypothetical protein
VRFVGGGGVTRDLSATGLFFLTDRPFDVGQPVELSVTFEHADPERPTGLTCRGKVCRVDEQKLGPESGPVLGVAIALSGVALSG